MKGKFTLYVLMACAAVLLTSTVSPASNQRMITRNWAMHRDGIQTFIDTWATGKSDQDFKVPLTMLLKSETNLMAYGVSIKDKRLIGHLMVHNGKPVSMRVFAARLFFKTFKNTSGWTPDMTATLKNKQYRILVNSANTALAENQFTVQLP